jgi:hypothetical protein
MRSQQVPFAWTTNQVRLYRHFKWWATLRLIELSQLEFLSKVLVLESMRPLGQLLSRLPIATRSQRLDFIVWHIEVLVTLLHEAPQLKEEKDD